jgi:hypothetical protein
MAHLADSTRLFAGANQGHSGRVPRHRLAQGSTGKAATPRRVDHASVPGLSLESCAGLKRLADRPVVDCSDAAISLGHTFSLPHQMRRGEGCGETVRSFRGSRPASACFGSANADPPPEVTPPECAKRVAGLRIAIGKDRKLVRHPANDTVGLLAWYPNRKRAKGKGGEDANNGDNVDDLDDDDGNEDAEPTEEGETTAT